MSSPSQLYPKKVDLTNCDKEPIHILGKIQAHGVLMVCDSAKAVTQHSDNIDMIFGESHKDILGRSIWELFKADAMEKIELSIAKGKAKSVEVKVNDKEWLLIGHENKGHYLLEFEPLDEAASALDQQQNLSTVVSELSEAEDGDAMCRATARLIKDFMGYDRVMVYRFDADWNGTVVAEEREDHLESWLGLHYPSTDIPQQARKLFLSQGERIIVDVNAMPVPILPQLSPIDNAPLDLSNSELRAASPIHIEYLKNMGVGGTLTAAIVTNDTLWGLIACHHYSPKFLNYHKRLYVKFLSQVFAAQLVLRQSNTTLQKINKSSDVRSKLIEQVSHNWDLHGGLMDDEVTILDVCDASGAALILENKISLIGKTPSREEIQSLIAHVRNNIEGDVFHTSEIARKLPEASSYKEMASGVMAIFMGIDKKRGDALIWFKPEVLQTVTWAGNPDKPIEDNGERLSPRKSFEKWSVEQAGKSMPWEDHEVAAAAALKKSISDIIIEKYEEVRELNNKLKNAYAELETFSYSISHDLRAPLRGIDGFAQIIKEDYFESLDTYGKNAIETIIKSAQSMNVLIDDILEFSSLSQKKPKRQKLEMDKMVKEALDLVQHQADYPRTMIKVEPGLPSFEGDRSLIIQLLTNLIVNALKYSSKKENPQVIIGHNDNGYFVKDNGIGFKKEHAKKIFGIFHRLAGTDFQGSGIGLAIAERVVQKHDGRIWAEGSPGNGAVFYFTLNQQEHQ